MNAVSGPAAPVSIMVAPNGARRMKTDHPALPITAEEVAADAQRCREAGANAVHVHVRDDAGAHVLNAERYIRSTELINDATGGAMVVQITTEAVGIYSPEQQMEVVRQVRPAAVSVALSEIVPDDDALDDAAGFFGWMQTERVAPQFILYEAGEVGRFFDLRDRGVIPFAHPFLLFAVGKYTAGQQSDPADLEPFLEALGERGNPWAMCAFGKQELACAEAAMRAGGHVRVGFENNLHMPNGDLAGSNAELVAATVACAVKTGRGAASLDDTRALIELSVA